MKLSNKLILLFLVAFCLACETMDNQQEPDGSVEIPSTNGVILFFSHPPDNGFFRIGEAGPSSNRKYDLSYYDDAYQIERIELDHGKELDTMRIPTTSKHIELIHQYKGVGEISLWAANGDTLFISYDSLGYPEVRLLNRVSSPFDFSFSQFIRKNLYQEHFSAFEKYSNLIFFINRDKPDFDLTNEIPLQQQEFLAMAEEEYRMEALLLDSIFSASEGNMSQEVYDFYQTSIELKILGLPQIEEAPTVLLQLADYADSWGPTSAFQNAFDQQFRTSLEPIVPFISDGKRKYRDYKSLYNSVATDPSLSGLLRELALQKCLEGIYALFSKEDLEIALDKYSREEGEFISSQALEKTFGIIQENIPDLPTNNSEDQNIPEFISRQSGRVVYVDFWASWCAPCIESFPDANVLRDEYSDSPVTFVFLSIDETVDGWENSEWKYELGENSFWVKNDANQEFLEGLSIKTIPRYLIYNKQGELVHPNAPGPGSTTIRDLLDQYIEE